MNVGREACTHYVGRGPAPSGATTGLGNPFLLRHYTRPTAVAKFEEYARRDETVRARIAALPADAVLGCWCKPLECHGDVIVKLWQEWHP